MTSARLRQTVLVAVLALSLAPAAPARGHAAGAQPTRPAPAPAALQAANVAPDSTHPYRPGVDVLKYEFHLTLPKSGHGIEGRATVTALRRMTLDTLVLDLVQMVVDSVRVGDMPRAFVRDSATVRIPLLPADGVEVRVIVRYHGEPADGLIIRETPDRGWSAFGDNWPNRARYWLPTVDHPSDKALVAFTIDAPAALTVLANGVPLAVARGAAGGAARGAAGGAAPQQLSAEPLAGDMVRTRYQIAEPIPTYLMVIAAAQLQRTPLPEACGVLANGGCLQQAVYTFPQETSYAATAFAAAPDIVAFFSRMAGPFRYEQLNHLQSATRFGGMENATAIFYSDAAFRDHAVGVGLIAHETAHQWFGDAVTPRRWQDVWLSEGFASYFAPLYVQYSQGDSAFREEMRTIRTQILAADVVAKRPVVDTVGAAQPSTLLNTNSYQKGAFVLHMLRSDVGDSAFFEGIRFYQQSFRNGTATTDNLRQSLEQAAGASLIPFFDQWLHRPGFAELDVRWRYNYARRTVTFSVHQGTTFAPFAVPLVVALRDSTGMEELHTLHVQALADQSFEQPLVTLSAVASVVLDPRVELLARLTLGKQ